MKITILGSGSSTGVPQLLCNCPVCRSTDSHNKRTRFSILFEEKDFVILVDAPFESRLQLLQARVTHIDCFWLTHPHSDHIAGIDDLRMFAFRQGSPLPFYSLPEHLRVAKHKFPYLFFQNEYRNTPLFDPRPVEDSFIVYGKARLQPIVHLHGNMRVVGFRWNDVAFLADISEIEPSELEKLAHLRLLIIAHTLPHPHFKHMQSSEVISLIQSLRPERAILTHMNHRFDYQTLKDGLPEGIEPGYDGLTISL